MGAFFQVVLFFFALTANWIAVDPLPKAVTNNAIAGYKADDVVVYYSFMGLTAGKTPEDVTRESFVFTTRTRKWSQMPNVPGLDGRLGAQAYASITGVVVFGGHTLDEDGNETTVGNVDIYVPTNKNEAEGYWAKGVSIPVPVGDAAVGGVDEYHILLLGGRTGEEPVSNVQVYFPYRDRWEQSTPSPGKAVFGHAGAVVGDRVIYVGGAYKNPDPKGPKYLASDEAWIGKLHVRRRKVEIEWTPLPPFPSKARFGIAAGKFKDRVVFTGGSATPHDYRGIGYDGKPAEPVATTFAYNVKKKQWETLPDNPMPTMNHRRLVNDGYGLMLVGGMEAKQQPTRRGAHLRLEGR